MNKLILFLFCVFSCALFASAQDDYHKFEISGGYLFERVKNFPGDKLQGTTTIGSSATSSTIGTDRSHNLNGFNASATYNFSRYFGAKFEFSGNYGSDTNHELPGGAYRSSNGTTILIIPNQSGISAKQRDYKYLGGVQFKDNSTEKKIKPFAHALFGVARQTTDFYDLGQQRTNLIGGNKAIKSNSFSMALGGGLDIRVSKRVDIRVFQFDYNPTFTKERILVANGAQVDSTVTSFSGGSVVTTLQDLRIPKQTQQNFRIGIGIVFH
jgi:opacity protein-like surface antigen